MKPLGILALVVVFLVCLAAVVLLRDYQRDRDHKFDMAVLRNDIAALQKRFDDEKNERMAIDRRFALVCVYYKRVRDDLKALVKTLRAGEEVYETQLARLDDIPALDDMFADAPQDSGSLFR